MDVSFWQRLFWATEKMIKNFYPTAVVKILNDVECFHNAHYEAILFTGNQRQVFELVRGKQNDKILRRHDTKTVGIHKYQNDKSVPFVPK